MKFDLFKKTLLTLGFMSLLVVPAFATNWVLIGDGHYIDTDSITPSTVYGGYTYTTEYLSSNGNPLEVINGKDIHQIITHSYIDCRANYAKTITYTAYDRNRKIVVNGRSVGKNWYDINTPGSKAYESYNFVCTDKYINARKGYNPLWWY